MGTTDGVQNTFIVNFDNYGQLSSVTDSAGNITNPDGEIVLTTSFTVPEANADENGNPYRQTFNINLGTSGTITGVYSNGTNRVIGQLALATFANDRGLEKAGDNTYVETNNSGQANIGESGVAGKGSLLAGALEMSNVDLSEQMTDMIVTQRGFQANSKTIQTADTLLETVLSLKR